MTEPRQRGVLGYFITFLLTVILSLVIALSIVVTRHDRQIASLESRLKSIESPQPSESLEKR
jgi:hypothetical protein